jgi:hypothetical protein
MNVVYLAEYGDSEEFDSRMVKKLKEDLSGLS